MQRQRRLSLTTPSASVVGGPARPPSPSLHRSTTTTSLATVRPPSSTSSLHRTPSSHLLSSLVHPSSATTAVCTTLAPEAAVIRSPTSPTVGISAAALVRSSSRLGRSSSSSTAGARSSSKARELPTRPIPISPTSPSTSHARRESALAAAIRHNDPSALRAERRRAEVVDSRLMHSRFGGVDEEALIIVEASSDGDSGESFEVPTVDTGAAGLLAASRVARASSNSRAGPGGLRSSSALAPQAPVQPRYSSGRRLSSLATYEGLPVPPALRGGASGAPEPELNYSLDALRSGAAAGEGGAGVRRGSSARRMSSSSAVRPPSPVPEGFRTSISPLTRSTLVTASIAAPPRRPSSPGPGIRGGSVRRGSSPARPVPSGVVGAASPALSSAGAFGTVGSVRRAPSPARGAASGRDALASSASPGLRPARPASPLRGTAESASSPRVVRGFDPPGRAPSPARGAASLGAPALVRRGSFSASTTSPRPQHAQSHSHSTPATIVAPSAAPPQGETRFGASPATRPRSHLADSHADERLEVQASRDFAVIDDYYLSRRRARGDEQRAGGGGGRGEVGRSEARENRREAEERLRKGYDRAQLGAKGAAAAR